jgi:hypothetical protein
MASDAVAPANATSQAPRLKKVAAEPTPRSEATTPPRTAPRTPTSSRPACVGSQSGGIEDAIQPATTPKTTQAAKPIAPALSMMPVTRHPCTARIRLHPHDRRCGHLGPYGLSPISPPREPHPMARAGRCVASLNHSQSSNGCRNPFPQGLRPRTLTTYIASLTGSLPWRKPHRSLAMGALWPRSCTLPAAGRGQRHPSPHRRRDGLTRTVPERWWRPASTP